MLFSVGQVSSLQTVCELVTRPTRSRGIYQVLPKVQSRDSELVIRSQTGSGRGNTGPEKRFVL